MEFNYKKNDNSELFKDFEKDELLNVFNIQNYVPIYKKFFSLNENNYNSINMNNENYLIKINKKVSENIYECTIKNKPMLGNINLSVLFLPLWPCVISI